MEALLNSVILTKTGSYSPKDYSITNKLTNANK